MRISDWSSDVCSSDLANVNKSFLTAGPNILSDRLKRLRKSWALPALLLLLVLMLAVFHAGWRQAMEQPYPVSYALPRSGSGGSPPLTIAFLSDTHAGLPDMPPERLSRIVDQVNALAPDLILLRSEEHTYELQSLMRNSYAV